MFTFSLPFTNIIYYMSSNSSIIGYYQVEPKERAYFFIKVVVTALIVIGYISAFILQANIGGIIIAAFAILFIWLITLFYAGLMKGLIKNSSVRISEQQLPEVYSIVQAYSSHLNLKRVPAVYLMQAGGQLNAFATRIHGRNYVILFSDLLEEFYQGNEETVRFVIAHELGHIKQGHLIKRSLTFPSLIVPFLNNAYSRACEYTCDNIGAFFSQQGSVKGITTLAAGKVINSHINHRSLIEQSNYDASFWCWFVEKLSTHPSLSKRLKRVYKEAPRKVVSTPVEEKKSENNHEAYMPK